MCNERVTKIVSIPFQCMEFHESGMMGMYRRSIECVCDGVRVERDVVMEGGSEDVPKF